MKRLKRTLENLASAVAFAEEGCRSEALVLADDLDPIRRSPHAKIILASSGRDFSRTALDYAGGLMERMHCDVLALTVGSGPDKVEEEDEVLKALGELASDKDAVCLHREVSGGLCGSIREHCRLVRDVRFAVVQAGHGEMASCALPIPIFFIRS